MSHRFALCGCMPVPCPSLSTDRLTLQPLTPSDYLDVALATTPNLANRIATTLGRAILLGVHDWVEHVCEEMYQERELAFTIRTVVAQPTTLGVVSLRCIDQREGRAELGFWLRSSARRRGYATEAAQAIVNYAFEVTRLAHLDSYQVVADEARARVLARLGFRNCGPVDAAVVSMSDPRAIVLWSLHHDDARACDTPAKRASLYDR
jgi:ribosomal-protein-alanine N-acetyltransferase